jgi:hypothetical protein
MLANHMQCWRAGDFLVTVTTDTPTDKNPTAQTITQYQKCRAHASSEQTQDAQITEYEAALLVRATASHYYESVKADTAPVVPAPVVPAKK